MFYMLYPFSMARYPADTSWYLISVDICSPVLVIHPKQRKSDQKTSHAWSSSREINDINGKKWTIWNNLSTCHKWISSISAIKVYSVLYISHLHNWLFHSPGPRHLHLQRQSHGLWPLHAAAAGADGAVEANLIHFHSFCTWEPRLSHDCPSASVFGGRSSMYITMCPLVMSK